ncbi:uncharacterized protein [Eurosta solidaginis]|uniref:uncharacterized protein n=1 Tax=Eurosta solidaginis TaxID=178769 RepID=UPI0035307A0F
MDKKTQQRRWMTKLPQYWKMVELLKDKPDIGQGSQRRGWAELDAFWFKLAEECNLLGPPLRKPEMWKRTWYDYKLVLKRKYDKCKRTNTMYYLTNLQKEAIKICDFEKATKAKYREDLDHDVYILERADPPSTNEKNSVDVEILPESACVKEEYLLYDGDYDNVSPAIMKAQQLSNSGQHASKEFQYENHPEKQRRFSLHLQERDDLISTPSTHNIEQDGKDEENKIKQLQQQIHVQKNVCKETQQFQMNTSDTLHDISLTLNSIRGSLEAIEDLGLRRLNEYSRHNRKIEELLQQLSDREISMKNGRK